MGNQKTKLWQKEDAVDKRIESFTVGRDRELDLHLAEFDVLGSVATHSECWRRSGLLTTE